MQRTTLSGLILSLWLFCGGWVLFASDADELGERDKDARKQPSVKPEQGSRDEADRLEKAERSASRAKSLEKAVERPTGDISDKEIKQLQERHQHLIAVVQKLKKTNASDKELAEVHEEIAAISYKLHAIHGSHGKRGEHRPEFNAHVEKLEAAMRRIHHFRVAAENLKAAEAHDLAHQLMKQAEEMERDVQEAKKQLAAEMQKSQGEGPGPDVVRELRNEIERLRAEVKELRQKVESR